MAQPAHPSLQASGISFDEPVVRHILGNYRTGGDKCVTPNGYTTHNGGVRANSASPLKQGAFIKSVPVDLRTRVAHVGQHTRGTQKYIIFNGHARIDRDIILNF